MSLALGIQLTLPEDFTRDREFAAILSFARDAGLSELELNIADPFQLDPADISAFLRRFGLPLTRFATGATARRFSLSLCSADPTARQRSVRRCVQCLRFAERFPAALIIGYLKGPPEPDVGAARRFFRRSLAEIVAAVGRSPVPVLIEATNRRESSVVNTLEEAARLLAAWPDFGFRILPDTYHLAAEGIEIAESLARHLPLYDSLHISDDNRLFPGLGSIDFPRIFRCLHDIGYAGSLVIEGSHRGSLLEDLRLSLEYLWRAARF